MSDIEYVVDGRHLIVAHEIERAILLEMIAKRINVRWASSEVFSRVKFVDCGPYVRVCFWGKCIATDQMREGLHSEWMLELGDDVAKVYQRAQLEYEKDMQPGAV
jgi:hypothetical protein